MNLLLTSCLALFMALFSSPAFAYLTIGESLDITPAGIMKIGVEPQIRLSEGSGANVNFFIDKAIQDDLSWRALIGAGETDLVGTASIKWVPIPDFEQQPAIGVRGDVTLARDADQSFTTFRIAPMISKQIPTEQATFSPYMAIPVGMRGYNGGSDSIAQLVLGSDMKLTEVPNMMFNAELGTNLNKAFSHLSINAVYLFSN